MAPSSSTPPDWPDDWPDDWPVDQEDPLDTALEQPILAPGAALQACSGADIYLAKTATLTSKRQYLAVLPGVWSFSKNAPNNKSAAPSEDGGSTQNGSASAGNNGSSNKTEPPIVARLEQAHTATPTLVIPLGQNNNGSSNGNDSRACLQLQGRHIPTTSKFVVLTVQPKKGTVVCKNIFSSCLVFGQAKIGSSAADDDVAIDDGKPEATVPLRHYGGSERTVDGSWQANATNKKKKGWIQRKVSASSSKAAAPLVAKLPDDEQQESESDEEPMVLPSDSDDDEFCVPLDAKTLARPSRSRRQSRKTIKYAEMDVASDESEEDTSDSDGDDEPAKKPAARKTPVTRKRSHSPVVSQSQHEEDSDKEEASKRRRRPQKASVLELDSDESSEAVPSDQDSEEAEPTKKPARTSRRRKPQKKVEVVEIDSSSEEDDEDASEEEPTKKPARKPQKTAQVVKINSGDENASEEEPTEKPSRKLQKKAEVVKTNSSDEDFDDASDAKSAHDDDSDEEAYQDEDVDAEVTATKPSRSRRALRQQKSNKVIDIDHCAEGVEPEPRPKDDADGDDRISDEEPQKAVAKKAPQTKARSRKTDSVVQVDKKGKIDNKTSRPVKAPSIKNDSGAAGGRKRKRTSGDRGSGVAGDVSVLESVASSPGKPSPAKRRRKMSPKKSATKRTVIDLADDDDFTFLG